MIRNIGTRVLSAAGTLVLASVIVFLVMRLLPGDPARLIVGPLASEETLEATRQRLGLNDPLWQQYLDFVSGFVRGDWAYSFSFGADVRPTVLGRLPATLELAAFAFVLAVGGAVVVATFASYRPGLARRLVKTVSLVGLGTPPFWFGLLLLLVFSSQLRIFPGPSGRLSSFLDPPPSRTGLYTVDALLAGDLVTMSDALAHLVLPAVALAFLPWAFLTRLLSANLADTARSPYVLVVRSKGISAWSTHLRHVLRNALLPTISSSGLVFAQLITGSVLVETVFNWPGVGELLTRGIASQDFSLVQTFVLLSAVIYVFANIVVDIVNAIVDPRLRAKGNRA